LKRILLLIFLFSVNTFSQVGVGTNSPDSSAVLDITSTTGGLLLPRMNESQRDAIASPATGLLIYLIDGSMQCLQVYNGTGWENIYCPTTNTIPVASNVGFSGTLSIGGNLTGTYTYTDNELDIEDVSVYQWYSANTPAGAGEIAIPGATNLTYVVNGSDNGKYLSFGVFPIAVTGALTGTEARSSYQGPVGATSNVARINEFHYDNVSTDVNEFVEIRITEGLANQPADLSQYTVSLYNGSTQTPYLTETLDNLIQTCDASNCYYVWDAISIQNGAPDGIALSGPSGLIDFISYEGTFAASSGIAAGTTSVNVGIAESNATSANGSIERTLGGAWSSNPNANTKGTVNSL
jgi:hypothetical protein